MASGSGFGTTGLDESNASLAHPHLHTSVDGVQLRAGVSTGDFVRDDGLGPSVPSIGHSSSSETSDASVFGGVLHGVHVHVHVKVDLLVGSSTESGSLLGPGSGNDLINGPVIVAVFDFEFGVQDLLSTEAYDEILFSRNDSKSQEGDQKMFQSHCE